MTRTMLDRLDDLVRWTGIPALAEGQPRRRPLRWPATLALAAAVGGFAIVVAGRPASWIGYMLLIAGLSAAIFVKLLGPLKPIGSFERVDEWDRAARDRAFVFTYTLLSVTLPTGLILLGGIAGVARWNLAQLQQTLIALGFLLMAVFAAMPTAYASWMLRWDDDE